MVNAAGILSIRAEDTEMESSVCAGEKAEQWLRATKENSKRDELWAPLSGLEEEDKSQSHSSQLDIDGSINMRKKIANFIIYE